MKKVVGLFLIFALISICLTGCKSEDEIRVSEHGMYHAQANAFRDGGCSTCAAQPELADHVR